MDETVAESLKHANEAFRQFGAPQLQSWFGPGRFFALEAIRIPTDDLLTDEILQRVLDIGAGWDWTFELDDLSIIPLGVRVQNGGFAYESITYRWYREISTHVVELDKLHSNYLLAEQQGCIGLGPRLSVQLYTSEDYQRLLAICAVATRTAIRYLDAVFKTWYQHPQRRGTDPVDDYWRAAKERARQSLKGRRPPPVAYNHGVTARRRTAQSPIFASIDLDFFRRNGGQTWVWTAPGVTLLHADDRRRFAPLGDW
jgi:hypothetical protein